MSLPWNSFVTLVFSLPMDTHRALPLFLPRAFSLPCALSTVWHSEQDAFLSPPCLEVDRCCLYALVEMVLTTLLPLGLTRSCIFSPWACTCVCVYVCVRVCARSVLCCWGHLDSPFYDSFNFLSTEPFSFTLESSVSLGVYHSELVFRAHKNKMVAFK